MIHVLTSERICLNCGGKGGKPGPCHSGVGSAHTHPLSMKAERMSAIARKAGGDTTHTGQVLAASAHTLAAAAHHEASKATEGVQKRYHLTMAKNHLTSSKSQQSSAHLFADTGAIFAHRPRLGARA